MSTRRAASAALLAALLAVAAVAVPAPAGARVADDHRVAPPESPPPFPGVSGVDLVSLGYDGPVLGGVDLEAPPDVDSLPEELFARAQEASERVGVLVEERDGLETAVALLDEVVRELNPRVAEHRLAEALAADHLDLARDRRRALSRRIRAGQVQLEDLQERMVDAAIAAYMRPPDADTIGAVLNTGVTSSAQLAAPVLHEAKFEHDVDEEDRQEVGLATLSSRREVLVSTERTVERRYEETHAQLAAMVERRDAHAEAVRRTRAVLGEVERRIEIWRDVLDEILGALSSSDHSVVAAAQARNADVPVVVVEGFRVHAALAGRLEAMLAAAKADGIVLRGWGHRSHQSQIALRAAHCGPEPENVWLKPPGQCSPPTAIPGTSMHELGLAVDFTHAGASIASHASPAFRWLAAHAADYGFFNLPSEPWHWSVNGR